MALSVAGCGGDDIEEGLDDYINTDIKEAVAIEGEMLEHFLREDLKLKVNIHPDELAQNYVELTNDLAYAQTFYPKSNTKEYLNELAIFAHQTIYKDQKSNNEQIKDFFTIDIPQAIDILFFSITLSSLFVFALT